MVMQLAALGIFQSQAMMITQMLGPSQVVIFAVAFRVIALPVERIYMGTAPFIAPFGEAKARRDWNWIKGAFKNATFASVGLGVPLAAALALVAKPLILFGLVLRRCLVTIWFFGCLSIPSSAYPLRRRDSCCAASSELNHWCFPSSCARSAAWCSVSSLRVGGD